MGYTHYWRQSRDFTAAEWKKICTGARAVVKAYRSVLCFEYDQEGKAPEVSAEAIQFNGKGDDGHETFILTRKMGACYNGEAEAFNFCKTAEKPYDAAVVAVLMVAKKAAPNALRLRSDGGSEIFAEYGDKYGDRW